MHNTHQSNHQNGNIISVKGLKKYFPVKKGLFSRVVGYVKAVDNISFDIQRGETLGLVGESGCGKTTTGRCILRLISSTAGDIYYNERDILSYKPSQLRELRRQMQIIFQDPYSSLNPRMRVGDIVGEALTVHKIAKGSEREDLVATLFKKVGLDPLSMGRYPHEFSGGQRQRIGIARAIALNPEFIVCDEAVSALDVSIQAQVINLLMDLREEMNLSYLFIAHDLSVVKHISQRIAVMYLGKIAESAPTQNIFDNPSHPYTQALLSAIPIPDPTQRKKTQSPSLKGEVPSPVNPPSGCHFHPRCPHVMEICKKEDPWGNKISDNHICYCHLYD